MPTGCQGRQKRRSPCYLADCDLLSVHLTKNNKITSLPHSSSSQGNNQSTPCFTVKRLRWQIDILLSFFFVPIIFNGQMWQSKKHVNHIDPFQKTLCNMYNLSLPAPSQPFHARGRFELVAGCMGKKGRGLVKKRQQATEMHNPTKSGLTGIRMQFQLNTFMHLPSIHVWKR